MGNDQLSPERQALQILQAWKAIDEPQRTEAILLHYIAQAIHDATCTPEERAVIEAAGRWLDRAPLNEWNQDLRTAIHAMLAATARTKVTTKQGRD